MVHKGTVPPIIFTNAMKELKGLIPKTVFNKLYEIVKLKSEGKEKDIVQNIVAMDNYIEQFLKDDNEAPREKPHATLNELNQELRKIVLGD